MAVKAWRHCRWHLWSCTSILKCGQRENDVGVEKPARWLSNRSCPWPRFVLWYLVQMWQDLQPECGICLPGALFSVLCSIVVTRASSKGFRALFWWDSCPAWAGFSWTCVWCVGTQCMSSSRSLHPTRHHIPRYSLTLCRLLINIPLPVTWNDAQHPHTGRRESERSAVADFLLSYSW